MCFHVMAGWIKLLVWNFSAYVTNLRDAIESRSFDSMETGILNLWANFNVS